MKLLIGIPAYNEQETIKRVVTSLPQKIKGIEKVDILVLDDGSFDETAVIACRAGALVVSHLLNRGLGAALKTIFAYAKENDYDVLLTFDADGQHDAGDVEKMLSPIQDKRANAVIGARWGKGKRKPFERYLVNQIGNILTFLVFGIWTLDSQSGLRAFDKKAIRSISLQSDGMEVSSEFFREIKRNRLIFTHVGVKTIYTDYSKSKGQKISNAPNVFFQLLIKFLK